MPANRKVSLQQMEAMLNFMEEHRALARGQAVETPQAKATVRRLWEELAALLNSQGSGCEKSSIQWRDYWRDIKYRVKKKVGEAEVDRRRTGGGPPSSEALTPLEERIYSIIGRQAVLGDETVRIPFEPQELQNPLPDVQMEVELETFEDPPLSPEPHRQSPRPSTSSAPPVETATSGAENSPAAKRRRRKSGIGSSSSVEIPQPRWAWEAEQNRLAVDERRLEVEERLATAIERVAAAQERIVTVLEEIKQAIKRVFEYP